MASPRRGSDLAFLGIPAAALVCCLGGPALLAIGGGLSAGLVGGLVAGLVVLVTLAALAIGSRRRRRQRGGSESPRREQADAG